MSKGGFSLEREPIDPARQVARFAQQLAPQVEAAAHARVVARAQALGVAFTDDELTVFAALDGVDRVQRFLNEELYYNNDHGAFAVANVEETAMAPRDVLRTANAHCFEGAMLAYVAHTLHDRNPGLVLLEASQDSEHNLIVVRDPATGRYGANAHSAFPSLDGRPVAFDSLRALAESYHPHYYSDRSLNAKELTLVGYSEPFSLLPKYGAAWMTSEAPLWDIYFTYIDHSVRFHFLFDDSGRPAHQYPLVRALLDGWIVVEGTQSRVCPERLPAAAQPLWAEHAAIVARQDREAERTLDARFRDLTDTTPTDLIENALELDKFLARGYRLDQILG